MKDNRSPSPRMKSNLPTQMPSNDFLSRVHSVSSKLCLQKIVLTCPKCGCSVYTCTHSRIVVVFVSESLLLAACTMHLVLLDEFTHFMSQFMCFEQLKLDADIVLKYLL